MESPDVEFTEFVAANARWFRGHERESAEDISQVEETLGVTFPEELRWLLENYGIWLATGISCLEEMVSDTLQARETFQVPEQYVVLENHHDGGVYFLDTIPDSETGKCRVFGDGWEFVPDEIFKDSALDSYLDYVREVLERQRNITADEHVDCVPFRIDD